MDTIGDILALLYTAHHRYSGFRATIRRWQHTVRAQEAMERWMARQPSGRHAIAFGPDRPIPTVIERTERLWMQKPSRWRHEAEEPGDKGVSVTIIDGDLWWRYHPEHGAHTNEGLPDPREVGTSLDYTYQMMFDPSSLIPHLSMEPLGRTRHAGREVIRVRAVPREGTGEFGPLMWQRADEYELLVDAERGAVLSLTSRVDGEELAMDEVVSIEFDEPMPDGVFTFTVPQGVKVQVVDAGPPWFFRYLLGRPGLVRHLLGRLVLKLLSWRDLHRRD